MIALVFLKACPEVKDKSSVSFRALVCRSLLPERSFPKSSQSASSLPFSSQPKVSSSEAQSLSTLPKLAAQPPLVPSPLPGLIVLMTLLLFGFLICVQFGGVPLLEWNLREGSTLLDLCP